MHLFMSSFEVLHPHCLGPILIASCELQTQTLESLLVHGLRCSSNTKTQLAKWPGVHFPYTRDAYTICIHPSIKDGLGFRRETKNLTSQRTSFLNKEKGKAPMASSSQRNHAFIYDKKFINVLIIIRVMFMLLVIIHMLCLPLALLLLMVEVGLGEIMLCLMCLGKYAMNLLLFFMLATLLLFFHVRMRK
jgi:hypothetical protein